MLLSYICNILKIIANLLYIFYDMQWNYINIILKGKRIQNRQKLIAWTIGHLAFLTEKHDGTYFSLPEWMKYHQSAIKYMIKCWLKSQHSVSR